MERTGEPYKPEDQKDAGVRDTQRLPFLLGQRAVYSQEKREEAKGGGGAKIPSPTPHCTAKDVGSSEYKSGGEGGI